MFAYGADGETAGGRSGRVENGEYFARVCREVVAFLEWVTDEGYAFRVDLRLRPEGRTGPVVLSLAGYRAYYRDRAELWERQALIKARVAAGDLRDEGADRPDARGEGRRGDERQARPWRDPRDRVPRPGAPAPLWRRRLVAARAQHAEDDLSAVRARVPGARPRPDAVGGVRAPAHRGAPAADPPRVPDPHAALVAARARPARPTRRHRRAASAGGARVPGAPPADHHHRAPRVSRLLRRARRVPRQAPPIAQRHGARRDRLRRPRACAPQPRAHPRGASARAVRGPAPRGARAPLLDAPRCALEEPQPRRGAPPVRALPLGGGPARRARRAARGEPRAPHRARPRVRGRRSPDAAPDRPARAPRLARGARAAPPTQGKAGAPRRRGPGLRPAARTRRAAGPAAPAQAVGGAHDRVALPPRGDDDRGLLARDDGARRGRAGGGLAPDARAARRALRCPARRARAVHPRGRRGARQARRPRALHGLR